jgi:hypothetical protein
MDISNNIELNVTDIGSNMSNVVYSSKSSKYIKREWRDFKDAIKNDTGQNVYTLLENVKDVCHVYYYIENEMHVRRKLLIDTWNCESIGDYIAFLENKLKETLKLLASAEQGFDVRNQLCGLHKRYV